MKNVHKFRGKREFSFDDKELAILGAGAVVICALLFVLGFLMGQGWQEESVASPLHDEPYLTERDLSATDETDQEEMPEGASPADERGSEKKTKLSYYQVLPDSETYIEVEATPVKKTTPAPEKAPDAAQPDQVASTEEQASSGEPADAPPQPAPTVTPAAQQPRQTVAAAPALPNVPKSPTDDIRVGRPTQPAGAQQPLSGTVYSVQVASSQDRLDSDRLQQKYAAHGYDAYVMPVDLREKGLWYRVMIGRLATSEEAERLRQDIMANVPHLANSPYVVKVN